MTRREFYKLEVGDYVEITQHGQNQGKIGKITKICDRGLGYGGNVYLAPYNCDFGFTNKRRELDGAYAFNHESIRYLGKLPNQSVSPKSDKTFYILPMYGEKEIQWPTRNFTVAELKIIDRFLKEFNKQASSVAIDSIAILDKEDDEG